MRIALVGLGSAGYTLHLPALEGIREHPVVGAVDPDAARRNRAAERFKVPVFEDFDAMLSAAKPELVIIGTPPSSHADYCLRALAAGAHVLCEKPFVWDTAQSCSNGVCTTSTYTFPPASPNYTHYVDLAGKNHTISGTTVKIGYKPIFLENQ